MQESEIFLFYIFWVISEKPEKMTKFWRFHILKHDFHLFPICFRSRPWSSIFFFSLKWDDSEEIFLFAPHMFKLRVLDLNWNFGWNLLFDFVLYFPNNKHLISVIVIQAD